MKTVEQNHYEFLGVEPDAPVDEIRRAVGKLREMFAPGSIALYSLVDQEEHRALLDRLEEAAVVLGDERARLAYDERHGLGRRAPEPPRTRARPGPAAQLELPAIVDAVDGAPAWPSREAGAEVSLAPVPAAPEREPGPLAVAPAGPEEAPAVPVSAPEPVPEPAVPALAATPGDELELEVEVDVELELEAEEPKVAAIVPASAVPPRAPERPVYLPPMPEVGPATEYTGDLLRRIREARGVSLRELATRTRISLGHLEHLEAEAFRELPERVYLRGFLTAYARELKLDGPRLAETYLARWSAGRRG